MTSAFNKYGQRDQTRREQLAELMERLNYRAFDRASFRHYLAWLTPIAQNVRKPDRRVGKDLREIQELLRHKNIRTTVRYTHVRYEQTRQTAEALSQILE